MRYSLLLLPLLLGLTTCVVETPAPVRTTYVTPAPTTTYVPAVPSTATVIQSP